MSRRGRGGLRALWCVALIESIASAGCGGETTVASTDTASSGGEAPRPRRRRRRRPRAEDTVASTTATSGASSDATAATGAAPTATIASTSGQTPAASGASYELGSPVVSSGGIGAVRVEWIESDSAVQCGAAETRAPMRCPQCPREPENAGIVRAFVAVERNVIRCNPPTRPDGKLPLRVQFSNDGTAMYVRFPGVRVDRDMGVCIGRAVCAARVPNFQNSIATVPYDIHVLVPES